MSDSTRTFDDVRTYVKSYDGITSKDRIDLYDAWAENYEKDMSLIDANAPILAVDCLSSNFRGSREEALVLDVACGTGLVSQLMSKAGFKRFEGIDASEGMLAVSAKTGLYQDLRQALLGTQPLPAKPAAFDVVMLVGGLTSGIIPVTILRELCNATKPGGLICMTRGDDSVQGLEKTNDYKVELEKEMQLMEDEGLWGPIEVKVVDKFKRDVYQFNEKSMKDQQDVGYIGGTVYLYRKSDK